MWWYHVIKQWLDRSHASVPISNIILFVHPIISVWMPLTNSKEIPSTNPSRNIHPEIPSIKVQYEIKKLNPTIKYSLKIGIQSDNKIQSEKKQTNKLVLSYRSWILDLVSWILDLGSWIFFWYWILDLR